MSPFTRARSAAKHRGKTPAELRQELDRATFTIIQLATEIDELKAERNQLEAQLDRAGIDRSGALEDAAEQAAINEQLTAENQVLRAKLAALLAIPVPAPRDLRPADTRNTVGTDVTQLRDEAEPVARPYVVMPLPEAAERGLLPERITYGSQSWVKRPAAVTDPGDVLVPRPLDDSETTLRIPLPQPAEDDPDATVLMPVAEEVGS